MPRRNAGRSSAFDARTRGNDRHAEGPAVAEPWSSRSCLGHDGGRFEGRDGFARYVQQTRAVVLAEVRSDELVHPLPGDRSIALDLLVDQRWVAEVRREERKLVGAFTGRLH